jgi:hypothetical protein
MALCLCFQSVRGPRPAAHTLVTSCSCRLLDEWVGFLSDQLHGTAPSLVAAATPASHVIPELQPSVRAARLS